MARLKVKDSPFLFRDEDSNGIINSDESAYVEYLKRKRTTSRLEEEKASSEARLNRIENEVSELKTGINQILELLKK